MGAIFRLYVVTCKSGLTFGSIIDLKYWYLEDVCKYHGKSLDHDRYTMFLHHQYHLHFVEAVLRKTSRSTRVL